MTEHTYAYYHGHAEELLNNFIKPIIAKIVKDNWSNRGIDILLSDSNDITEEDIDYGEHSIFAVYHDNNNSFGFYSETQLADYFVFSIDDADIKTSSFVFAHHYDDNDIKYERFSFSRSPIYDKPFHSFDEVSKVIEVLKQLILDKYSKAHNIHIYTEKEYQIQEVSKLYAKIEDIKNEYNLDSKDLANAKSNCNRWLGY